MKKISCLFLLFTLSKSVFSQSLQDGIYLIDSLASNHPGNTQNRQVVHFSPYFIKDDPEAYEPLVLKTDDFFRFELAAAPMLKQKQGCNQTLFVQLTETAKNRLSDFTAANLNKSMAVVVDGEAVAQYVITKPVNAALIRITGCAGISCKIISRSLNKTQRF